jgi:3-methyladenine DNA glycosylase/8-oxoguanine DNA glycosylase
MRTAWVPIDGIDVAATVRPVALLPGDPTVRLGPGRFERAAFTPEGPGTIRVTWDADPGVGRARACVQTEGDGAAWLLDHAPELLGARDDVTGFEPGHGPVRDLWRRHRGVRLTRTGTLWNDLAWLVVQQRVTHVDAAQQWHRLVVGLGTPAPGATSVLLPPSPERLAALSYPDLHRFGIERQRANNLLAAARDVPRLQRLVAGSAAAALPHLRAIRGVGPWTSSFLAAHTWGEPDTVIVGDAGLPSAVAWLLAGERRADDARLVELLEPFRPHRYRVIRLVMTRGVRPPRRRPLTPRTDIRRL